MSLNLCFLSPPLDSPVSHIKIILILYFVLLTEWTSAIYFCTTLLSLPEYGSSVTNTLASSSSLESSNSRYSSSYDRYRKNIKYIPIYRWSSSSSSQSSGEDCCTSQSNITPSKSEKSSSSESMILVKIPKKFLLSFPGCQCKTSHKKDRHRGSHKKQVSKANTTDGFNKYSIVTKLKHKNKSQRNHHHEDTTKLTTIRNSVALCEQVKTPQFQKATNEIFDKTLEEYRNRAKNTGKISIKFEDLEKNFTMTFFRYEVHGKMLAWNGKLKDLSTLYRSGNVLTETDNKYLNFTVPLVLKNMIIDFEYCEVTFMRYRRQGTAKGHVGHNLITVQLAVPLLQACSIHLNKVELTDFSRLTIDMIGLGLLDNFHKRAANSIMADHTKKYKHSIEKRLSSVLRTVFESTDLCNFINDLKNFGTH